jgi:hypothetical protein
MNQKQSILEKKNSGQDNDTNEDLIEKTNKKILS